ncbi:MAG: hypothetical protein DBY20_00700 [Coriobacteriia bacterium]|nr:MAG: hypothetical protein DBY20_08655 [Coriobacteriia bacterium]PWL79765.1 MAG: hypothetical protein DBY20_00655 [Coriobacteriia bacterium]PWL79773.1 MAG: hypothetical protein DBY20_00700 [Coriobacteriia bacterium]
MQITLREIPIVGIDKAARAFIDAHENRYFEVSNDLFVMEGPVEEGTIAYHGSGSHGGHIVLKPFYKRKNGRWTYLYGPDNSCRKSQSSLAIKA